MQFDTRRRLSAPGERGLATISALVVALLILGMSGAILTIGLSTNREGGASGDRRESFFVANSGISDALVRLSAGNEGNIGAEEAPVDFSRGGYFVTIAPGDDETFTVTSTGMVAGERTSIEAIMTAPGNNLFDNAIFAGNSSGDPLYTLELGGAGKQADLVTGDVYSGGDVELDLDADVTGTIRASGSISGDSGESGVVQGIPDLAAMDYENTSDFDVYDLFVSDPGLVYTYDNAGGNAYQVPEANPAHIFRVNPSNRSTECNSTAKLDFFLEDPYEAVGVDSAQDGGADAYKITLSGSAGEPGPNSNNRVFFIDGNLWVHNKSSFSMMFYNSDNTPTNVTFVVKGNIYFSDNVFYEDKDQDGAAFIALKDSAVSDSGNIYFGDPVYGTLQVMHGFMYAENNFYDNNLDASGSSQIEVYGIMSAGNHVSINRDYGSSHTKMTIEYDDRIATGALELPNLPLGILGGEAAVEVVSWRIVPSQ